jgi:hypothetical protein
MSARKRGPRALDAVLALVFALGVLGLGLKLLTLPAAGSRALSGFEPRPDFLDRPHRHRATRPAASAPR